MHDWEAWAIPALAAVLVPLIAAIWASGKEGAVLSQKVAQQRVELDAHEKRIQALDNRLDDQARSLVNIEAKLDIILGHFQAVVHSQYSATIPKL